MLSYMTLDNFMLHIKLFFWFRSKVTLAALNPDAKHSEYDGLFKKIKGVYSHRSST